MGLKESGLRGSLRNVSVGIDAIPDSGTNQWPHDDDASQNTLTDSIGNTDGQINGPIYEAGKGVSGLHLAYDGVDDHTLFTDGAQFDEDSFDWFLWVRPDETTDADRIIDYHSTEFTVTVRTNSNDGLQAQIDNGDGGSNVSIEEDNVLTVGEWSFVAFVADNGNEAQLYHADPTDSSPSLVVSQNYDNGLARTIDEVALGAANSGGGSFYEGGMSITSYNAGGVRPESERNEWFDDTKSLFE